MISILKNIYKKLFILIFLTSIKILCVDCCDKNCISPCDGYPFLSYRSQGRNIVRQISGSQDFVNKFGIDVEYTRSFRPGCIANYLFGRDIDCCNKLSVQGSIVKDRNQNAWLADYFGLPMDFDSKITFSPRIQNIVVDLDFYLCLDRLADGLFLRMNAPIVWTKWELNMCEHVNNKGTESFAPGYMSSEEILVDKMPKSFMQAMSCYGSVGDIKEEIRFGRMTNCKKTKGGIADFYMSLGWDFLLRENGHLGVFLNAVAPTGNRPKGRDLFEPIVGNGKHWELGFGVTSSWVFWRSCECEDRYMGIWFEAVATHLFNTCQRRSFDFCGKPNSRYMLLAQMGANEDDLKIAPAGEPESDDAIIVNYQYKNRLIPAINKTTFDINVKIDAQVDLAIKLGYINQNWTFDLGYNLWARTGETFCFGCKKCCTSDVDKKYAIKGDAFVYGYIEEEGARAISATQSTADIHKGTNYPISETEFASINPRIDNPTDAREDYWTYSGENLLFESDELVVVNTSVQPILASWNMLDVRESPSAITHKIFGSLSYAWKDRQDCEWPFVGMGFQVEFAQKKCSENGCKCSKKAGVSQWGIWLNGGVFFD